MIRFSMNTGSTTVAESASIGLMHWFMQQDHDPRITYSPTERGLICNMPDGSQRDIIFLCMEVIQRRWKVMVVVHFGREFEERCMDLLMWLKKNGDIVELKHVVKANLYETSSQEGDEPSTTPLTNPSMPFTDS